MFLQTVGQRDYVFHCLGARGDGVPNRKSLKQSYSQFIKLSDSAVLNIALCDPDCRIIFFFLSFNTPKLSCLQ